MKLKTVAFGMIFTKSLFTMSPDQIKENFKNELYRQQSSLMPNKKQYTAIIEPFLQEANRELVIAQYCLTHSENSNNYFQELLSFNEALFDEYCYPHSKTVVLRYQSARICLKTFINNYKYTCPGIDENKEFAKTENLFKRASAAYYKELPLASKISIYVWNFFLTAI